MIIEKNQLGLLGFYMTFLLSKPRLKGLKLERLLTPQSNEILRL